MKKRVLSILLSLSVIINTFIPNISFAAKKDLNISRISGKDRYITAVEASKNTFDNSSYAVVASGEGFADALVGGTLATQINAPILLVKNDFIPSTVVNELKRLNVEKIFLLGGVGTVTPKAEGYIENLGISVERLAGANRYETALAISEKRFELYGENIYSDDYAIFDGQNFADALSAAPFIGLQSNLKMLPYIKDNKSSGIVFGGVSSVPKMLDKEIRYAGANRESTAIEVARAYKAELGKDIDTIVLVDGYNYPDALAAAPVASINNGAVLLTNSKKLSAETKSFINSEENIENIIIVGGYNSVSKNIEYELRGINPPIEPTEPIEPTNPVENGSGNYNGVYIASINSNVFHRERCRSVSRMNERNKRIYQTREEAIKRHPYPCKTCRP